MFALVESHQGEEPPDECEVVPLSWLSEDRRTCAWPPKHASTSMIKKSIPPENSWPSYPIKVLYISIDYDKVVKKRAKHLTNSNLESEGIGNESGHGHIQDESSRKKRKRKKPYRYQTTCSSDSDTSVSPKRRILERPPIPCTNLIELANNQNMHLDLFSQREVEEMFEVCPESTPKHIVSYPGSQSQGGFLRSPNSSAVVQPDSQTPQNLTVLTNSNGSSQTQTRMTSPETANQNSSMCFETLALRKLEKLSRNIVDLTNEVRSMRRAQGMDEEALDPDYPKFPLQTRAELDACEDYLKSESNVEVMTKKLSKIDGHSDKDASDRVMSSILSDEFAILFNWAGVKRGETPKQAFKRFKLVRVVAGAVLEKHNYSSHKKVENFIKEWLKYAKKRLEGVSKRSTT